MLKPFGQGDLEADVETVRCRQSGMGTIF